MTYTVEVVLREKDFAISEEVTTPTPASRWTEDDVETALRGILRAIDRARNPGADQSRPVVLRGFSWIVEPSEGGVVIAIEIPMGAAVAGPFDVAQEQLDALISSALKRQQIVSAPVGPTVH
ncbi:MAG: hypothetical protein M3R55_03930 [Acidobacteriota bacterium]|nr:hypothetical protein [Acidobacteriota bacterium]